MSNNGINLSFSCFSIIFHHNSSPGTIQLNKLQRKFKLIIYSHHKDTNIISNKSSLRLIKSVFISLTKSYTYFRHTISEMSILKKQLLELISR